MDSEMTSLNEPTSKFSRPPASEIDCNVLKMRHLMPIIKDIPMQIDYH